MVDVYVVLAGRFATLPAIRCSVPRAIALPQRILVRQVIRFSYGLELCCIAAYDVQALARGMAMRTQLMLEAEATACAWVRRVGRTPVRLGRTPRVQFFIVRDQQGFRMPFRSTSAARSSRSAERTVVLLSTRAELALASGICDVDQNSVRDQCVHPYRSVG